MPSPVAGAGGGILTPGVGPPLVSGPGDRVFGPRTPAYGPTLPVPGPGYVMPFILTPGPGPNGPLGVDARKAVVSVGEGSSVPYGAAGVGPGFFCQKNGIWGFRGPAVGSIRPPTIYYMRVTGSNNNGGTSNSAAADRTGTDGVCNNTVTFTSASAAFTKADVNKGICMSTGATARHHRIATFVNATTVTLDRICTLNAGGQTWAIGGAWASPYLLFGDGTQSGDANSPVNAGDIIYMGAGVYRPPAAQPVNAAATYVPTENGVVSMIGDVTGLFTGDAGIVEWSAYASDSAAPAITSLLNAGGNFRNVTFQNLLLMGGSANVFSWANVPYPQNMLVQDCTLIGAPSGNSAPFSGGTVFGIPANMLVDRCRVWAFTTLYAPSLSAGSVGNDYNVGIAFTNSTLVVTGNGSAIQLTGAAGTKLAGGFIMRNCVLIGVTQGITNTGTGLSTLIPAQVYNNIICGGSGSALTMLTLGSMIEDYNALFATSGTPRTLVAVGAHSLTNAGAFKLHMGQELQAGLLLRPLLEPMAGSPFLAFGNDGAQTAYDLLNRPRPAGGGSFLPAIGALDRGETATQSTTPAPAVGTHVWKNTGPWYQDFMLPVSNAATTVAIDVQRDAAYAGALPQFQIFANPSIGVTAQTITDTNGSGSNNTLTSAPFTPSATGWVTVRIWSRDLSGTSVVAFSNVVIS